MTLPDEPDPKVSVVIPVYNSAATIDAQLEAVAAQELGEDWEVVVVDNGSTDGTGERARGWAGRLPRLRVLDAPDRRGISHARNVGARAARGELIAVCDADDVVSAGWLQALVDGAAHGDVVGGSFEEESLNSDLARSWRHPRTAGELPRSMGFLPYAVGANCCVRAAVFQALGGWNENYTGGSDVEFSWRAQLAGFRLVFVPDAVVLYRYRSSLRSLALQAYRRGSSKPRLYRDFLQHGVRRRHWRSGPRAVAWLVLHLPLAIASARHRGTWLGTAASTYGRVRASIELRVVYL